MTKTKSTKRALLSSALALMMCISMLIGSTFAWFTDSVTSSSNKIQSGTLKLDLEMLVKNDDNTTSWKSIKEDKTALFNYTNWEPGYTDVKVLKVENEGSLALKWVAKFVAEKELSALANVIDVYVCPSETEIGFPADRTLAGYTRVGTVAEFVNTIEETTNGTLEAGKEAYLGIALKMQETAGNEYQGLDLGGAFDIQILATQYTFEKDSFDNQYDKDAEYLVPVKSAKELTNALAEGKDVELTEDIEVDELNVASGESTVDLNGNDLTFAERDTYYSQGAGVAGEGTVLNIVNTSTEPVTLELGDQNVLVCANGATLNLENVNLKINELTFPQIMVNSGLGALSTYEGGTINFYSGTIEVNGVGVMLNSNSTFNMYGGEIILKDSEYLGAGIVNNGENVNINLYGGKITVSGTKNALGAIVMASVSGDGEHVGGSLYIGEDFVIEVPNNVPEYVKGSDPENKYIITDERDK